MLPIRATAPCILCMNMGAQSRTYAWVDVTLPTGRVKELGLCFKHVRNVCDRESGEWKKTPYGKMPIRDEKYSLKNNDTTLVTGTHGKIPKWL